MGERHRGDLRRLEVAELLIFAKVLGRPAGWFVRDPGPREEGWLRGMWARQETGTEASLDRYFRKFLVESSVAAPSGRDAEIAIMRYSLGGGMRRFEVRLFQVSATDVPFKDWLDALTDPGKKQNRKAADTRDRIAALVNEGNAFR